MVIEPPGGIRAGIAGDSGGLARTGGPPAGVRGDNPALHLTPPPTPRRPGPEGRRGCCRTRMTPTPPPALRRGPSSAVGRPTPAPDRGPLRVEGSDHVVRLQPDHVERPDGRCPRGRPE